MPFLFLARSTLEIRIGWMTEKLKQAPRLHQSLKTETAHFLMMSS